MTRRAGMDSRELYPSDEQRRRIMDFIMAAGETLLENGKFSAFPYPLRGSNPGPQH